MPNWKQIDKVYKGTTYLERIYLGAEQVWPVLAPKSLSIERMPSKVSYTVGERLNLSGIKVEAVYAGYYTDDVTSQCSFSPANNTVLSSAGVTTVTVSFTEKGVTRTASFSVAVTSSSSFSSNDLASTWTPSTLTLGIAELNTQTQRQEHSWLSANSSLVVNDASGTGTVVYHSDYDQPVPTTVPLDSDDNYTFTDETAPDLGTHEDPDGEYVFNHWYYYASGDEQTVAAGDTVQFSAPGYTIELYAVWEYTPYPDQNEE